MGGETSGLTGMGEVGSGTARDPETIVFSEDMVGRGPGAQGIIRGIGKAMLGRVQKVA